MEAEMEGFQIFPISRPTGPICARKAARIWQKYCPTAAIGYEVGEIKNNSPPDDGLKFLLSLPTVSREAASGSPVQLSSKPTVILRSSLPGSDVLDMLIWEYPKSQCGFLGKRDIRSTDAWLEKLKQVVSQDKCSSGVTSEADSMFSRLKDREGEERVVVVAKGAAFFAHKFFSSVCWTKHSKVFLKDPDALHRVQWEVLKALLKLALSVFDLEDFIRVAYQEEMKAERLKFIKDLFSSYKTAEEAILYIARGEMTDDFSLLCECDVNSILERRRILSNSDQRIPTIDMDESSSWMFEEARVSEVLTEWTISLMKHYPELKTDCVKHLITELAWGKCCCIRDTLLLECWGHFNFEHLNGLMLDVPFVDLDNLTSEIYGAMTELIEWKVRKLGKSMESATLPLRWDVFGTFAEEVIEVFEHADCERRLEGHRFIGTHHLLLGLVHTRIRESVLMFLTSGHGYKHPSTYPASFIFPIARKIACFSGEEKIDLEHLFSAIMFENLYSDELANDIYETIVDKDLALPSKVVLLGVLCMYIGIGYVHDDKEVIPRYSLAYGQIAWNAEFSSLSVDKFFEGVNKCIRREAGFPMAVKLIQGRPVEGSVWEFVRCVSGSWESACNRLPALRENGGEEGDE